MNPVTGKVIAGCFALSAFAVAIFAGLAAQVDTAQILLRSIVTMFVCYPVGLVAGLICQRVIQVHIEAHQAANPSNEFDHSATEATVAAPVEDEEAIVV